MERSELIRERGNIKATLTRFKNFLASLQPGSQNLSQLESRLDIIVLLYDKFSNIQDNIEFLTDADQIVVEESERIKFENEYFTAVSEAKRFLKDTLSQTPTPSRQSSDSFTQMRNSISQAAIKLPTIDLPSFDGSYEQYLYFRDTFESLIDKNDALAPVQKFHYLRAALKGKAASIIQSIELSDANYAEAWKLVKERYDNKRLLTNNHVKAIFNLPNLPKESYDGLRTLLDNFQKHLRALKVLQQPVDHWDCLIVYLISSKLDSTSRRQWEEETNSNDIPTIDELIKFLNNKCQILESIHASKQPINNFENKGKSLIALNNAGVRCAKCKSDDHYIQHCTEFLKQSPEMRSKDLHNLRLCINCLRPGHVGKECRSSTCRKCSKKHNTLVHFETKPTASSTSENTQGGTEQVKDKSTSCVSHNIEKTADKNIQLHAFLSTAVIKVEDRNGKLRNCRALLDNGSESNFITQRLCDDLGIKTSRIDFAVAGINQALTPISHYAQIKIYSRVNSYNRHLHCLVIPKIADKIPTVSDSISEIKIPSNIKLADPNFNNSSNIDLLIGVATFYELQCVGQIFLENSLLRLTKTLLGWVVSGPIYTNNNMSVCQFVTSSSNSNLNKLDFATSDNINKFWELDEIEVESAKNSSQGELYCENNFTNTTVRHDTGRFVVTMPLNERVYDLGESKDYAAKRFLSLERKLENNLQLKQMYHDFIKEYIELGHMSKITDELKENFEYFLPHHAVLKPGSTSTKLRTVFDASAKSTSGVSLNDCLHVGPKLQDELFAILLRFRKHKYVLTGDVSKMFRQVFINESHRPLQKILWRFDPSEEIEIYQLNTVTYGTAASSYLAIRALQQTAADHKNDYPEASAAIFNDFYVDDLITGLDSKDGLIKLGKEIRDILQTGGFDLRKWASNNESILREFSPVNENSIVDLNGEIKALGICFKPVSDEIQYSFLLTNQEPISKRTILSNVAQIFDPLGILSPIVVKAKLIIQKLWKLGISWDESVPASLYSEWVNFRDKLSNLNHIKYPRRVLCENSSNVQLHAFSDASQVAYSACVYIRSRDANGRWHVRLLCAKTKVAPIKKTTLPRLELCGALLLAKLVKKVRASLNINFEQVCLWTDSSITLAWIKGRPERWQPFVANRVTQIQNLTSIDSWYQVKSENNPADLATRGINPDQLIDCKLWWAIPWLTQEQTNWHVELPEELPADQLTEGKKKGTIHLTVTQQTNDFELFQRFSSFTKLIRVTAYILRFYFNSRNPQTKNTGNLVVSELQRAEVYLIRVAQRNHFSSEINSLLQGKKIHKQSGILSLTPLLDDNEILRVGGRLSKSDYPYDKKHPILLPKNHALTILIMRCYHLRLLHCGAQMLLYSVREKFWPISGKNIAKRIVHECITCFRVNPRLTSYLMGDLPKVRVESSFPFTNTGTDYAGPFAIKTKGGRGTKIMKGYVCLFVCLSTKALHLELVMDLTTDGFLSALKRFFARRGKCCQIYSDNGKNFVGASKELVKTLRLISKSEFLTDEGITWHFLPPRAPNFGGIWEAGVKSVKHHLKRVVGNLSLTYDEFLTVLNQVEAILNSRPLSPLSNDPNDINPLTPGHFLIGRPLTSTPDPNLRDISSNRLSKYLQRQQIVQHFWQRWNVEYIQQLQTRVKWKLNAENQIKVGAMVVVREENTPPLKWCLGRIKEVHPGADNVIRVVTIQCSGSSVIKRPVSKVCVLPIESD